MQYFSFLFTIFVAFCYISIASVGRHGVDCARIPLHRAWRLTPSAYDSPPVSAPAPAPAPAPLCKEEAEEAQGPTEAAATPYSSLLLPRVSSKQSLSPHFIPFHSISILFSSSPPIEAGLEISSAGWFMLTHKA